MGRCRRGRGPTLVGEMANRADGSTDTGMGNRDTYKTLDLALRTGEMLLAAGARGAAVAATLLHVAHACGLRAATADVPFTELAMSHQRVYDEPAMIQIRQVRHREIDYEDLTLVDHLVRDLVSGRIARDRAGAQLARIVSSPNRLPRWA